MNLFSLIIQPLEEAQLEYYLEGGSEKHINDIRAMLQQDELSAFRSSKIMNQWAQRIGVSDIWGKLSNQ